MKLLLREDLEIVANREGVKSCIRELISFAGKFIDVDVSQISKGENWTCKTPQGVVIEVPFYICSDVIPENSQDRALLDSIGGIKTSCYNSCYICVIYNAVTGDMKHQSKNISGLRRWLRRYKPVIISLWKRLDGSGRLHVGLQEKSTHGYTSDYIAEVNFCSYIVMRNWCEKNRQLEGVYTTAESTQEKLREKEQYEESLRELSDDYYEKQGLC